MRRFFCLSLVLFGVLAACAPITQKKLKLDLPERPKTENYRLVPGDVVRIDVFQEPDMQSEQRVAQDGTVNLALIGSVHIGGHTTEGAATTIEAALKDGYLVNPQVTVSILAFAPRRFTILGQVNSPGAYELPVEEFVTLPQAIAMAGGNTRIGNLHRVLISRTEDDSLYEFKINALHPKGRQFFVKPGDIITVPESLF